MNAHTGRVFAGCYKRDQLEAQGNDGGEKIVYMYLSDVFVRSTLDWSSHRIWTEDKVEC